MPKPDERRVSSQWDEIAAIRDYQLRNKLDSSYELVLKPSLIGELSRLNAGRVLDFGCGTGVFTLEIAKIAGSVVGLDPSAASIAIAATHDTPPNVTYVNQDLHIYRKRQLSTPFTAVVANMVFMNVLNLDETLLHIAELVSPDGHLLCTITHPFFWPSYWGYNNEPWFEYTREIAIEAPFVISSDEKSAKFLTTHMHRPLQRYIEAFAKAGFRLVALVELSGSTPPSSASTSVKWRSPRFLLLTLERTP